MLITRPVLLLLLILVTWLAGASSGRVVDLASRRVSGAVACEVQFVREQDFGQMRQRATRRKSRC